MNLDGLSLGPYASLTAGLGYPAPVIAGVCVSSHRAHADSPRPRGAAKPSAVRPPVEQRGAPTAGRRHEPARISSNPATAPAPGCSPSSSTPSATAITGTEAMMIAASEPGAAGHR